MNYKDLKIVFMGTPVFAVASLEKLVEAGCNIVGVVTSPDKPAGRGMHLQQSDVKKYAIEKGLKVLQPDKLKNEHFLAELKSLQADLQIVVAFRMLPEPVWNMPPMGTINLHGSLLPQYRGAAPINWAIINGECITGVTTFKLKHEIDTGDVLLSQTIDILEEETAGTLHDKMKVVGADLLLKTVELIASSEYEEIPQKYSNTLRSAPKIFTETCHIDWNNTSNNIYNLIRGLSPYPAAFSYLEGKKIKVFKAYPEVVSVVSEPGTFETDGKNYLRFITTNGYVYLTDVQLEGKKRMNIQDFLRGYRFAKD